MISNYKTIQYDLENTEGITIAELIVKLKELPQEDFCDDYYLTFRGDRIVSKEELLKEYKNQINNLKEQIEKDEAFLNSHKTQIQLLEIKLKELENNDTN